MYISRKLFRDAQAWEIPVANSESSLVWVLKSLFIFISHLF
jgi:hypothetical protein